MVYNSSLNWIGNNMTYTEAKEYLLEQLEVLYSEGYTDKEGHEGALSALREMTVPEIFKMAKEWKEEEE